MQDSVGIVSGEDENLMEQLVLSLSSASLIMLCVESSALSLGHLLRGDLCVALLRKERLAISLLRLIDSSSAVDFLFWGHPNPDFL